MQSVLKSSTVSAFLSVLKAMFTPHSLIQSSCMQISNRNTFSMKHNYRPIKKEACIDLALNDNISCVPYIDFLTRTTLLDTCYC